MSNPFMSPRIAYVISIFEPFISKEAQVHLEKLKKPLENWKIMQNCNYLNDRLDFLEK